MALPLEPTIESTLNRLTDRTDADALADSRVVTLLAYIFAAVVVISALAALLAALPVWLSGAVAVFNWVDGFAQNLGTEMAGAIITFVLIQVLLESKRQRENAALFERIVQRTETQITQFLVDQQNQLDQQERAALVSQLSSRVPGFA
ncbi:MAG: hypothetical protein GYB64_18185, partial [Chloroflexi bacterium]|nr:hypothetical protein [Chloroflexota bacterium]